MLNQELLKKNSKLLVAVSGGKDSVVLLDLLVKAAKELQLELAVVHFNHLLRGENSQRDAEFVKKLAQKYNLDFYLGVKDVAAFAQENKLSIEDAAREARYAYFIELAKKIGANQIALAHNCNDQVETVLMRFLRGAAGKGLSGIPETRSVGDGLELVRPLLNTERVVIEKYALEHKLENIEDETNNETVFFRNQVRHKLIPFLKKYNDNLSETIVRMAQIFKDEDAFLQQQAQQIYDLVIIEETLEFIKLDSKSLKNYDLALQRRVVRQAIERLFGYLPEISLGYIDNFLANGLAVIKKTESGVILVSK